MRLVQGEGDIEDPALSVFVQLNLSDFELNEVCI